MKINGLVLPDALQVSLKNGMWTSRGKDYSGRWHEKHHIALFKKHFPRIINPLPDFFSYDTMERENAIWKDPDRIYDCYIGQKSVDFPPGDVEPRYTVIIGESEPDSPIALDYRSTPPKVIYFYDVGDITVWGEAFKDIDELILALELLPNGLGETSANT